MRTPSCPAPVSAALLLLLAVAVAAGGRVADPVVEEECEDFISSHNIGGAAIYASICVGASGDWAVDGVDVIGEWIDVPVTVSEDGCFSGCIVGQCHAWADPVVRLSVRTPGGSEVAATEVAIEGDGIGCQHEYYECAGAAALCVGPGSYRLRCELLSGGALRLDVLRLYLDDSPAAASTWGAIKSLY